MKQLDAQSTVSALVNMLKDVKHTYENNQQDITYLDNEYNDLNHAIELLNLNASQGFKMYKQLKKNRTDRRIAKDTNQQLKPLYDFLQNHSKLIKELNQIQNEVQKIKKQQKNRDYRLRVRSDMQEAFDKAKAKEGAG
jgi:hypothetical protein